MSSTPAATEPTTSHNPAIEEPEQQLHFAEVPLAPVNTLISLGALRMQQNMSLDAAASSLRLSQAQIAAMEAQNWAVLPSAAYVRGFLRNYTRLLGVAPEPYIAQFEGSISSTAPGVVCAQASVELSPNKAANQAPLQLHKEPTALSSYNASGHQEKSHQSLFGMVGLLIAATLLFLLYWERGLWLPKATAVFEPVTHWMSSQFASKPAAPFARISTPTPVLESAPTPSPTPEKSAVIAMGDPTVATNPVLEPRAANTTASTSIANAISDTKPAAPLVITKPAIGPIRALTFQMDKSVWLEVRDSGNNIVYYGTKNAGTKDIIKGAAPLTVVIGAADALKLSVDGAAVDLKQQSVGNVARIKIQ